MTSSSDTFPFGIADVVELLGLTVRRRLPSSLYLNCPFCGDLRGRLNVNTDKNVWRCNRCGAAGGMLALYARYNCTGNADAYREICEALGRYTPRPRVNDCIGVKPEQNIRATPQEIHQTYSLLLSMLPLTPTHKAHLLSPRRGLTEEQIARFGFKSTPPAFLCRSYAERLRRHGCTLQGVPGFYQDDAGRWTINFGSRTAGILLPAVGMDGLICGMQIRLDTPLRRRDDPPGKSGAKYIWLSSIGKPHGVTSSSPLHFVGEPFAKTVYVTEGLLKADIAYCLTGRSFVAVAGVNSLNGLESALRCMAQNGTKLVVEAYDMDKLENEYVASAAEKVQQIARVAGLQSTSLSKSRKVYDLDENGERIKLPSGRWKSHKEDTVDWNDQKYCEIWRHEWEVIQNRYLEANDRPERVDLRSYARQGLDIIPTVHEGAAVRQMEKRGIQTNIGNLNREIRAANRLMKSIRQLIQNLKGWITELGEKRKELLAQKAAEEATLLPNLLMKYMEIRKEERKDWTRAGQNRGTSQDLKAVSEALSYLRQKGLSTVEDLEAFLESSGKSAADYRNQMKPKEARSKVIDGILASRTDCKECKPVYEKYQKIFFKKTKEKFKQEHPEVARYAKAAAYLAKHPDDKDSTQKELQEEQETLLEEIAELKVPLTEVQEDLKKLRDIRYWVRKATPGTEESKEPPKKQPIKEVLQDKADEKKAQRTAPAQAKHRQQDMEL